MTIYAEHARACIWLAASCIMSALLLAVPTLWAAMASADAAQAVPAAQQTSFDWDVWGPILLVVLGVLFSTLLFVSGFLCKLLLNNLKEKWDGMHAKIDGMGKNVDEIGKNVNELLVSHKHSYDLLCMLMGSGADPGAANKQGNIPFKK